MRLLIAIPTYNEAENIERFIEAVFDSLRSIQPAQAAARPDVDAGGAAVLVVDDNSPDGTADIVEKLIPRYPDSLYLLKRPGKQGLGTAYLAAFDWGLSRGYDVFLEMDADFSHNPSYIPEMLKEIETHDVVIGSRNIRGGGVEGWSALRNFISKGGSLYARLVLGCNIKDLTGGFNMWTRSALERINLSGIISKGYSFQVEMKFRAYSAGCRIKEIPIIFVDRKMGKSKMSKKIFVEALLNMWKIKRITGADSGIDQFMKFAVTGALGTVTNLSIFFLCADIFHQPEIPVGIFCFLISVTQNYTINHRWSFRQNTVHEALSFQRWLKFTGASLLGFLVSLLVMKTIILTFAPAFKVIAQACGIMSGMVINFILSKLFVFRKSPRRNISE